METGPFTIELKPEEIALVELIKFDPKDTLNDIDSFQANGNLVAQLLDSLFDRKAIPVQRLKYFSDPKYLVGGRGNSRQALFIRNAGSSEKMIRHAHFLKYLRYFIQGADLPSAILTDFKSAVQECGLVTSGDIPVLSAKAKQLSRKYRLEPKSGAEEFFKLCLDLNLDPIDAISIRSAVLQIRSTK